MNLLRLLHRLFFDRLEQRQNFFIRFFYLIQSLFFKNAYTCPFCESQNYQTVHKKLGLVHINHCQNCRLYWTNPIFNLPYFYSWLYRTEQLTTRLDQKETEALVRSGFTHSGKSYEDILSWLAEHAPGKTLLEFGSSWGYFLYQAGQRGFEAVGVEPSKKRRKYGKVTLGVKIISDIDVLIREKRQFDAIVTFHTLEHLGREIKGIFEKFSSVLRPGGLLVIEVPRLDPTRPVEPFSVMGIVHPLGFDRDFFLNNLPRQKFKPQVFEGRDDLFDQKKQGDDSNWFVVAEKTS